MRKQNKDIELAKQVWKLVAKGNNNVDISKALDINRTNVIAIKKYTTSDMYLDPIEQPLSEQEKLSSLRASKLKECQNDYKDILKEKTSQDEELERYSKAYFSIKSYREYFYGAIVASIMIGFFSGGFLERKIMESQGYSVTLDQFLSQR